MKNNSFCFFHAPETVQERRIAVTNGGLASRKNNVHLPLLKIKNARDVIAVVEEAINLLRTGKIHPNFSNSIFLGCNILLKAQEQAELELRLDKIEQSIKENRPYGS